MFESTTRGDTKVATRSLWLRGRSSKPVREIEQEVLNSTKVIRTIAYKMSVSEQEPALLPSLHVEPRSLNSGASCSCHFIARSRDNLRHLRKSRVVLPTTCLSDDDGDISTSRRFVFVMNIFVY